MPFAFHESCMHHRKSKRIMYASIPTHPDIGSDTRIPPIQSYIFKHLPHGSPWGFGPLQGHADPRHRKVFFHQYDQCAIDIKSQAQVAFSAQVLCTIVQTGRSSWLRQTPPLAPSTVPSNPADGSWKAWGGHREAVDAKKPKVVVEARQAKRRRSHEKRRQPTSEETENPIKRSWSKEDNRRSWSRRWEPEKRKAVEGLP